MHNSHPNYFLLTKRSSVYGNTIHRDESWTITPPCVSRTSHVRASSCCRISLPQLPQPPLPPALASIAPLVAAVARSFPRSFARCARCAGWGASRATRLASCLASQPVGRPGSQAVGFETEEEKARKIRRS